MTALEVIDQIKALPPDERAKVVGFVQELSADPKETVPTKVTFEQATKEVFEQHAELMKRLSQ